MRKQILIKKIRWRKDGYRKKTQENCHYYSYQGTNRYYVKKYVSKDILGRDQQITAYGPMPIFVQHTK